MKRFFSLIFLTFIVSAFFVPIAANAGVCMCGGVATATPCSTVADPICTNTAICPSVSVPGGTCDVNGTTPSSGGPGTTPGGSTTLTNPIGTKICAANETGQQCIQHVLGSVIKTAMGIVGSIALLMAVWGGFLWLTSMGNETRVETGKKTLIWSILGLVLIFGAYALTTYIFSAIAPTK